MIAILHNVRSSHNVGSIFRTADAAGFEKIYLCGITPRPVGRFGKINHDIAKVALGAESYIPWEAAKQTLRVITKLKRTGYQILALEQAKTSVPHSRLRARSTRFALVMGNEITGLPRPILAAADKVVEISMSGRKESLNVAVAFGIVAFHLRD